MNKKEMTAEWFRALRDNFRFEFEQIEREYAEKHNLESINVFQEKNWSREGGGGGTMSIMRGNVFEKVGVNISTVYGEFSPEFRHKIPGTIDSANFFATGISIVAHMRSPLVPAMHFNTRYIATEKEWFGGGGDLTPMFEDESAKMQFHDGLKRTCDRHNLEYYPRFKQQCDEYFYLKHRQEPRGVGGIFYDYLCSNFDDDFSFTQDVGRAVLSSYSQIVRDRMNLKWTEEQRQAQLVKRGRYVEFNLLYDRGTAFGLATGGNVEAILMSMPPEAKWP